MKVAFRALIILIALIGISTLLTAITGLSLVLPVSDLDKRLQQNHAIPRDSAIVLFSKFDFSSGNWKAYININPDDFQNLHPLLSKRSCVKTEDRALLQQMQKAWVFKARKDADLATVESNIYLFRENELVFSSGIVLDSNYTALQNQEYGFMLPVHKNAMVDICRQFKPVYWPVVLF